MEYKLSQSLTLILADVKPVNIKIKKPIDKSTLPKKAKIIFVIEFDTTIIFTKPPRLYV